jgi:hypothetical protein
MQNVYAQYYQALQGAEANSLSFDDNGQPLNQVSYEWMLNNPDKFESTFGQQSQSSQKAIGLVDDLLSKNTEGITGRIRLASSFESKAAGALLDQLVAELQLEEARRMKGQGAMSDAERKILSDAVGALNLTKSGRSRLSDDQFRAELMRIKEGLGGVSNTQDYSALNTQLTRQFGG